MSNTYVASLQRDQAAAVEALRLAADLLGDPCWARRPPLGAWPPFVEIEAVQVGVPQAPQPLLANPHVLSGPHHCELRTALDLLGDELLVSGSAMSPSAFAPPRYRRSQPGLA